MQGSQGGGQVRKVAYSACGGICTASVTHGLATGLRGHRVIRVSFQQIAISYAGIEKMQRQMTKILRRVKQQRAIRTATSYISM